jgi:gas vesicle protein
MANKKVIIGVAVAAAVLAGVAVAISRKKSSKKFRSQVDEAKANFKSKLKDLERKAQKEYRNATETSGDAVNTAKDRATEWVNKAKA